MRKQTQTQVKETLNKPKWNWRVTLAALLAGAVIGTLTVLVIDKYRMRNVVCQIVGVDQENAVIGARCMIK